ncbi:MAG: PTS glucose transporter subunit IIA [Selenomonadaceae bacterium]|nr:PTS glucose transporter subunit IIA [Selenomonadaceae bacterium]
MTGKVLPLEEVPDPIFAEKLSGDGLAVMLDSPLVVAPVTGEISVFFETKHAFMVTAEDGTQVLTHIGLDSIVMEGVGITAFKERGDFVRAGEPILEIDLPFFLRRRINLLSPVLIVNYDNLKLLEYVNINENVTAGKDLLLRYQI